MSYVSANTRNAMCGTANQNWLLTPPDRQQLEAVKEDDLYATFGDGLSGMDIDDKGYSDMEWYFQAGDENTVWGIGWRNCRIRLRGKGECDKGSAKTFLTWLQQALEKNETISLKSV